METVDVVLLVMTLMNVFMFIIAILYRCRRIVCRVDEVGVHMATVLMLFTLILTSIKLDKPLFVAIGLIIFAAITVYHFLMSMKEGVEE
jgi:hypothetical protein